MGHIYILTFPNNKKYVGQTTNLIKRYSIHKRSKKHLVGRAIQKYNWENVIKEEIECPDELLDDVEITWIKSLNTLHPNGYNLDSGGNKEKRHSEQTNKKISESLKKKFINERHWLFGKTLSEKTKEKIRKSNMGQKRTKTTRDNISKSRVGKFIGTNSPNFGLKRTEETKKKIGEKMRRENHYLFGKHISEETKRKMSEAKKGKIPYIATQYTKDKLRDKAKERSRDKSGKFLGKGAHH
jgi:group I intron endonuclease